MLRRTERGFSLVELMVAMVAGLGVVLCITSLYMALLRTDESLMARIHLQQGLQFLLDSIERDAPVMRLQPLGRPPRPGQDSTGRRAAS